jgi:hypothetical protein
MLVVDNRVSRAVRCLGCFQAHGGCFVWKVDRADLLSVVSDESTRCGVDADGNELSTAVLITPRSRTERETVWLEALVGASCLRMRAPLRLR